MSTVWREGCVCEAYACVSTPMKIPRTMNEKYAIIRAEEEEQRRRKTSVKREETVTPTACRRIMGANPIPPSHGETPHILPVTLPTGDTTNPSTTPSVTTPHARPVESQPNSPW